MKTVSPLTALGAALLLALPVSVVAQPPKDRPERAQPEPKRGTPAKGESNEPYGRWDKSWGTRPSAPPKHWTKKSDWYRHVRACQKKYRSYNARTDTYRTSTGKTRRCPV